MKRVLIIYKFLPEWRVDFFNGLRGELAAKNIDLALVYGKMENEKQDEVELAWGTYLPNRILRFGRHQLIWQPAIQHTNGADLVIVEQANKLLLNYILMGKRKVGGFKFALWGHGINRQADPQSLGNRFKRTYFRQADWWFAYTEGVKRMLVDGGYPTDRITIVQNAIDTKKLRDIYLTLPAYENATVRKSLSLGEGPVGMFCGGMYKEKRLDFLMKACNLIREHVPTFEMIFIGGGPDAHVVKAAMRERDWLHYVGPVFGQERVKYFAVSDVLLMPGLVGLAALDSFAMKTPLVTTQFPYHSPEIEYIDNGRNGIITKNDLESYAGGVISLLKDQPLLEKLNRGCVESAERYTLDAMVQNFSEGVVKCLMS